MMLTHALRFIFWLAGLYALMAIALIYASGSRLTYEVMAEALVFPVQLWKIHPIAAMVAVTLCVSGAVLGAFPNIHKYWPCE